jgi:hypothetical protein
MSSEPYPDTLILWDVTWPKAGTVRVGPAIADPKDPMLAIAGAYQRIVRRDSHYVMEDPGLTPRRRADARLLAVGRPERRCHHDYPGPRHCLRPRVRPRSRPRATQPWARAPQSADLGRRGGRLVAGLLTWSPWPRVALPGSWPTERTVAVVRRCLDRQAEAHARDRKGRLGGEEGQP